MLICIPTRLAGKLTRPSLTRPFPEALANIDGIAGNVVVQSAHSPPLVWTSIVVGIYPC